MVIMIYCINILWTCNCNVSNPMMMKDEKYPKKQTYQGNNNSAVYRSFIEIGWKLNFSKIINHHSYKLMYILNLIMRSQKLLCILALVALTMTIDLPLQLKGLTCTAIMSSFDPIKIDLQLPAVPDRKADENFKIVISSFVTQEIAYESFVTPETIFRKSIELEKNIVYELCISFQSDRRFKEQDVVYIPYSQAEDFQSLIGHIQIPSELAKEENLKQIYQTSKKIEGVAKIIASHQSKERALEDQIVEKSIHKTQRILTLSFIECLVIILSGVYQICALRKFLVEKNLY